jgi:hypothetical protein
LQPLRLPLTMNQRVEEWVEIAASEG